VNVTSSACAAPLTVNELTEYWLNECAPDRELAIEEHLLGCRVCSGRLQDIVALADGVKNIVRRGGVGAIVTSTFVGRLKDAGVRVREYRLEPGGSVLCTIAPEDDLNVAYLAAPLEGVSRLDLVLHDPAADRSLRLEDIPFNPAAGGVVVAPEAAGLRRLGNATQRMQLIAVQASGESVLGSYTFIHSPYR